MKKSNIGIITFSISEAGYIATSNLVDIISSFSNKTYLITGNKGYDLLKENKKIQIYGISHKAGKTTLTRILKYILTQLKISYLMRKTARSIDVWIFFIGGNTLFFPMLAAKLSGKKVILALPGSSIKSFISTKNKLSIPIRILEEINHSLTDFIILYSSHLIKEWNLEKHKQKIFIADRHFLDFDIFKINKPIDERKNLVGFIGRLSEEKGIFNFIKATQIIAKQREDIEFLIAGDGEFRRKALELLHENNLENKVRLIEWIPHKKIPDHLNELKLLILPSYTEGLPNIILEAMACGTPVLATSVGAIPDVIVNDETGFIIKRNNPSEIAEDVIKIMNYPDLQRIIKNARNLVEKKFTFENSIENYKQVFEKVIK